MKKALSTLLLVATISLGGCLRGESKSLGDIHTIAKERYEATSKVNLPGSIPQHLTDTVTALSSLEAASDAKQSSAQARAVAESLTALIAHAGYTSRASMTELRDQYLHLSQADQPTKSQIALLGSRTLSSLASELETTRFGL